MKLTIEKLVHGGAGLARSDFGVVFVPRTAPGDVVSVEIMERKKDYAVGRVVQLLEPSPDRQDPFCPNYETAGCCHWQHIRYARQLDIKEAIIRETLQRVGHLEWDMPITRLSGPDRNYRLRATFHVTSQRELGFMRDKSHTVVPIRECAAFVPELNDFIAQGNAMIGAAGFQGVLEVHAVSGTTVAATFVSGTRERKRVFFGDPPMVEANGIHYRLQPETFFQANRFLLSAFAGIVVDRAGLTQQVLELYCGSGFFSLPLARIAKHVIGIEGNRIAVALGRENAKLNKLSNVQFLEGETGRLLEKTNIRPELVLLNPPRAGAGAQNIERIADLEPERVLYVSCNPATFAREAAVLETKGFKLRGLTMIDQFPNTSHIELAALFSPGLS